MGIYIAGMKMPTVGRILIIFSSGRTLEVSTDNTQNILGEAQAIPVPPHGDLIDRDALAVHKFVCVKHDISNADGGACYRKGWNDAIDTIMVNAPTIISADTQKDDEEQAEEESEQIYKAYDSKAVKTGIKAFPEPSESEGE